MTTPNQSRPALIEALVELVRKEDRAALAELRRGLGREPGTVFGMSRYVEPYIRAGAPRWEQDAHYLVAALFASHPQDRPSQPGREPNNLGASFSALRQATDSESIEQRFVALLNAHRDDLPEHLRHAVALLRSREIGVDWARLLRDIRSWHAETSWVQRDWARAFWGRPAQVEAPAADDGADAAKGDYEDDEDDD